MVTYRAKYDMKPAWVEQVENLLVALEMYRIEEEKAINHLADILNAYGIDVSARRSVLQRQKHLKQQSERKRRCDNGRRDSGSGADHPCCL